MALKQVVSQASHRPWPLPEGPWVMTQWWRDLLFAHWPVDPEQIQRLLPDTLEVDCVDGQAWVGVVPFRMTGVRPRACPDVPGLSSFAELNVRTYVRPRGKGQSHPGVFFWSLDANNSIAVWAARTFFYLPYMNARMSCQAEGDAIAYRSLRTHSGEPPARFVARYGGGAASRKTALTDFLTERYCLYTSNPAGDLLIGEIHHAPWPLEDAWAEIAENDMAQAAGISLPGSDKTLPLLHFARAIEVAIWPLRKLRID